ncbi:immunoglobulin-binding protein 1-like isoform X2 [Orbicella faveolata]|uniref:immunoglobulin-binding protein 1-like isoform X2 n=1 Tax=Orbicella faveolata TaxID=48498 RepID=UPI0009E4D96A|nr:immunoglobulin-binding protein 1-like isoform X2 [Orbicella faveolata]XP_020608844.1 immunoglobulin-binding protein 1-like isoform X2 [Orbicella faveolata]
MAAKNVEEGTSLRDIFQKGFILHSQLEDYDEPSSSEIFQNKVTTAVNHFVQATEMVNSLALFSRNEELSEVPTSELRFLLLPAFLGDLFLKQTASDRMTTLNITKVYFIDYLKRCKNYGVIDMDLSRYTETSSSSEMKEKSINQMANSRQEKITRYKEQKEQERQLKELKNILKESSTGDEDVQRNYYVVLLKLWVSKVVEHLTSLQSEMEILEHMKVLKGKGNDRNQENKPLAAESQQGFKPILITREMIKDKVFGAGYPSVPTMSQEEFLEKEILEGKVVLDYKDCYVP